jgi:hypothetical protein
MKIINFPQKEKPALSMTSFAGRLNTWINEDGVSKIVM